MCYIRCHRTSKIVLIVLQKDFLMVRGKNWDKSMVYRAYETRPV